MDTPNSPLKLYVTNAFITVLLAVPIGFFLGIQYSSDQSENINVSDEPLVQVEELPTQVSNEVAQAELIEMGDNQMHDLLQDDPELLERYLDTQTELNPLFAEVREYVQSNETVPEDLLIEYEAAQAQSDAVIQEIFSRYPME